MNLVTRIILSVIVLTGAERAAAQQMSTPYSVYGIGDLDHRIYNHNSGMGYTGIALKSSIFSSGNNPASPAGMQKSFLSMDLSAAGRFVTYSGDAINSNNSSNRDLTIKNLSIGVKAASFWASGIGFKQLSSVNYSFTNTKSIQGANGSYAVNYSGDGGLNAFYWNNAFNLGKHFVIGVTSSYVTGSINQTASLTAATDTAISGKRQDSYGHLRFETGAIYSGNIGKKWSLSLGATYANQTNMSSERTLSLTDNTTNLLTQSTMNFSKFSLPAMYGAGISLSNKRGQTFAVDYSYQDWSSLNIYGDGYRLVGSHRISAGAEFARYKVDQFGRNAQKRSFQFGAYVNNSYLQIGSHQIDEYGFTAGFSHSLRNGMLYTISGEGGVRGTTADGLIKENFFQVTFNLSLREFLLSRLPKYN